MQRWQLTTGLALSALLAAFLAPSVLRTPPLTPAPAPEPVPVPLVPVAPDPAVSSAAANTGPLSLSAALDSGALLQGAGEDRFLVIEIGAPADPSEPRLPVHLAVVMDTSGSMNGRGKITTARAAASELVDQLGPNDSLSLVTFDDTARVLLRGGPAADADRMKRLIQGITPGGGTNIYEGLTQGQALLQDPSLEGVRRVVLLSDGMANLGVTDPGELARIAGSLVAEGVTVSGLGLGLDYNEDLLAAMSDAGGGNYHFVDAPGQLAALFSQELAQMGSLAGRQVSLDVDLAPGVELLEVYGYTADVERDGYRLALGDIPGGATRKVVARVRIDDSPLGSRPVASVALRYSDPQSAALYAANAQIQAEVTRSEEVVRRAINPRAGTAAAQAAAARYLESGARAWARGDAAENNANLEEGERLLRTLSERYAAPELEKLADDFEEQRGAYLALEPASDEGLFQVKKGKEFARELSH